MLALHCSVRTSVSHRTTLHIPSRSCLRRGPIRRFLALRFVQLRIRLPVSALLLSRHSEPEAVWLAQGRSKAKRETHIYTYCKSDSDPREYGHVWSKGAMDGAHECI